MAKIPPSMSYEQMEEEFTRLAAQVGYLTMHDWTDGPRYENALERMSDLHLEMSHRDQPRTTRFCVMIDENGLPLDENGLPTWPKSPSPPKSK